MRIRNNLRNTESEHESEQDRPHRYQHSIGLDTPIPAIFMDAADVEVVVVVHPNVILKLMPIPHKKIRRLRVFRDP